MSMAVTLHVMCTDRLWRSTQCTTSVWIILTFSGIGPIHDVGLVLNGLGKPQSSCTIAECDGRLVFVSARYGSRTNSIPHVHCHGRSRFTDGRGATGIGEEKLLG